MFSGLFHDVLRMFSGCSDGSCGPGGSRGFFESDWLGGSGQPGGSCELWVWLGLVMCKMLNV